MRQVLHDMRAQRSLPRARMPAQAEAPPAAGTAGVQPGGSSQHVEPEPLKNAEARRLELARVGEECHTDAEQQRPSRSAGTRPGAAGVQQQRASGIPSTALSMAEASEQQGTTANVAPDPAAAAAAPGSSGASCPAAAGARVPDVSRSAWPALASENWRPGSSSGPQLAAAQPQQRQAAADGQLAGAAARQRQDAAIPCTAGEPPRSSTQLRASGGMASSASKQVSMEG